jgi:hypothetical protein
MNRANIIFLSQNIFHNHFLYRILVILDGLKWIDKINETMYKLVLKQNLQHCVSKKLYLAK